MPRPRSTKDSIVSGSAGLFSSSNYLLLSYQCYTLINIQSASSALICLEIEHKALPDEKSVKQTTNRRGLSEE